MSDTRPQPTRAGTTITVVHSGGSNRHPTRVAGVLAAADERSMILHLSGDDRGGAEPIPVGTRVSLVVQGRPHESVVERTAAEWLTVALPDDLEFADGRSATRVATASLPATVERDGCRAHAHVVDLSTRGARLLVEWDDGYVDGEVLTITFEGATGTATIRRVDHEERSLLAHLGVEFTGRGPDLLRKLLRAVGRARADRW